MLYYQMIYEPREDTYLIKKYISNLDLTDKQVLEIGTGSGLIAETMLKKGANVTATDINPEALSTLKSEITTVKSDLFENVEGRYDLIVFNPPYLPEEDNNESSLKGSETWLGGAEGIEITEKFLRQAEDYLTSGGSCLLVMSSLSSIEGIVKEYDLELIKDQKLWFERLYLYRYKIE